MQIKRFRFSRAINFRDMGGVCAESGKLIQWNTLYRSDKFNGTPPNEWKAMADNGIKTIIDLRSLEEVSISPDQCPENFNYIHFPLVEENLSFDNISSPAMQAFAKGVGEGYKNIVLSHGKNLAEAINLICLHTRNGGVVFHCTSGKDRTGVVAASLYYLMGVATEDIAADYQTSYTYNKIMSDRFMEENPQYRQYRNVVLSDPDNIYELLELFDKIHLKNYLASRGMNENLLEELIERVLI